MGKNHPRAEKKTHPLNVEVVRLQRVLDNRRARVAEAERKLAAAKERAKARK